MYLSVLHFCRSRLHYIHWKAVALIVAVSAAGYAVLSRGPFDHSLAFASHIINHRHSFAHASFPTNNVAVIVKTGATVSMSGRLAALLCTSLAAVKDPLIVSDLEQMMGKHRIHDAFAHFPKEMIDNHPDFALYRKQQEYVATGDAKSLESLSKMPIPNNKGIEDRNAAWALDRYKFPRMVELAISERPDRDWYVFMEDDTYLSHDALLQFLAEYDPGEPWYIGSPVRMPGRKEEPYFFGYGGSGFILSRAVMKEWENHHYDLASHWDQKIQDIWFGDWVMAQVLHEELGLRLTPAWPMLNNDEPSMIPFGHDTWCQPAVTLHHMQAQQFNSIYQAEKERHGHALNFRDAFAAATPSGLPNRRGNWTNEADKRDYHETKHRWQFKLKPPKRAHRSYDSCHQACEEDKRCFMFSFVEDWPRLEFKDSAEVDTKCHLSDVFRLGHAQEPSTVESEDKAKNMTITYDRHLTSGWMTSRIDGFREKKDCGR